MRTLATRIALGLALVTASLLMASSGTANAAPPPPGYPTNTVKTTAINRTLGPIPIRQGFWNADTNRGFGFDKAIHKHNLYTVSAQKRIMLSPTIVKQGNGNYRLTLYAGRYRCSGWSCKLVDKRTVYGIHNGRSYITYRGWPVGGVMGMQTAYCRNPDGAERCPNWVTPAIDRPGAPTAAAGQVGAKRLPEERGPVLTSADRELFSDVEAGRAELASSPTPLPTTIAAPR